MLCYYLLKNESKYRTGAAMKTLKPVLIGIIIGLVLGLWFGVNIGKQQPFYSNPFKERSVGDKLKSTLGEGVGKAGETLEKIGKDLQGTGKP